MDWEFQAYKMLQRSQQRGKQEKSSCPLLHLLLSLENLHQRITHYNKQRVPAML